MSGELDFERFGYDAHRFVQWVLERAGEPEESSFAKLLREHFGTDPADFPVTRENIAAYDRPNLQLALDAYLEAPGREHTLVGFGGAHRMMEASLAALVGVESSHLHLGIGPVERTIIELDDGRTLTCVGSGLYLVSDGEDRLALHFGQRPEHYGGSGLQLEVMAPRPETGERFIADLRGLMVDRNVYRGKMLALEGGEEGPYGAVSVRFLSRPATVREDIVLPKSLLDAIDLNTIEFARVREHLARSGMHLRRGLLLHGPPGTGKTLTVGYLANALADRTVVVLTGGSLGLVSTACAMARDLQPAMVVLEDVDLVAAERTYSFGGGSLLFELLNEMDGIGGDADVVFVMTTNRADLLEPALVSRPGRVDQAIELPLPDPEERGRLLELYCSGVDVELQHPGRVVERTGGASPAFIRELVRKASVHAAVAGVDTVSDAHFDAALTGLEQGGLLTRRILGAEGAADAGGVGERGPEAFEGWEE
ncbi:MAG: hypothetical protein QOE65_1472 [Solirubrobacteraceae bacterium]|nr:hypothetical protein [Solirubrobacteraceae bacterium]